MTTNPEGPREETREELLAQIEQLRAQAFHDPLTGLPNRALFEDRLERALVYARRTRHRFSVLVLDLDGFKGVNDSFGHEVGDALLRATAQRLKAGLRESDTVARLGGDEFGMVLYATDRAGALNVAKKLRVELSEGINVNGIEVAAGVSIGSAVFPDDETDPHALLRTADAAMYVDKREGEESGAVVGALRKLGARFRR